MSAIADLINQKVKEYVSKARADFRACANYTNDELYNEAIHMYDSMISQFYSYKTKSYIRHGETKPGTGTGTNLYYGQQIKKKSGAKPSLTIFFSGDDMAEGYEYDSAETVLGNVMRGIRGVPPYWYTFWSGAYQGKYFSYKGSLGGAFDAFNNNFDFIMRRIFMKQWRKFGWK